MTSGAGQSPEDIDLGNAQAFRVGVLLPLTGSAAKMGEGMKNAAQLALIDAKNPNLVLQFYDTQSSESGARIAIENAISGQSKLIIGPLLSSNLRAIAPRVSSQNIPVISFATNADILGNNIWTLGLTTDEQIERIMSYSILTGRNRFALLLPDNTTGQAVLKAAKKSAETYGAEIARSTFYAPDTSDFSATLKEMTNYNARASRLNAHKSALQQRARSGDTNAQRELKTLGKHDAGGEVDFDAVIIAEGGAKLKSAISMFGYYDVNYPKVLFMGTSIWEGTSLNNEEAAINSIYPALSRNYSQYFTNKYQSFYEEKPNSLYALAYDAVALSSKLTNLKNPKDISAAIIKKDGYAGINGNFRFLDNGHSEHSLDIYQVQRSGDIAIDFAPKKFQ